MIWDARPFQGSEANLVSIGVSIWRRLAIKWYTLVQKSQYLQEKREWWPIYMDEPGAHAYSPFEGMAFR